MKTHGAKFCRFHALDQRNQAQAAFSADVRALHVRWANFYSDRLARLDTGESDCANPA